VGIFKVLHSVYELEGELSQLILVYSILYKMKTCMFFKDVSFIFSQFSSASDRSNSTNTLMCVGKRQTSDLALHYFCI